MTKNRLYRILSRIVDIKPGEELISISLFSYFFLITTPFYIIKPLRIASFLDKLGANQLYLPYLLTAALMGFVVAFHSKLQVKISKHLLIISSLTFFTLTCFLFWLIFPYNWSWLPLAFWIWANILIIVLITQFWILLNEIFNPREAKRLIGFLGSGGILGGIVGAEVAGLLAKTKLSGYLLLFASGLLIACAFVVNYIFILERKKHSVTDEKDKGRWQELPKGGFKVCFDVVRKSNYLRLKAGAVSIMVIVSLLIDWQFNKVIEEKAVSQNSMTSFFGHFFAGMLFFSFFLQLFLTSSLIKRLGIRLSLMLLPLVLLLFSLGFAVSANIFLAVLIKGSDKGLSYSFNQSVHKLLYIPVSPEIKHKAETFIDMFLYRFAKGIGAVILFLFISIHLKFQYVSLAAVGFILAWIFLNQKISDEYVSTVKQKLKRKWGRADRMVAEKLDVDYTKLVFDTLESKNRSSVLYAMHLFDLIKQDKLTPEVKKIISYKSDEMRISSLGTLFEENETTLIPKTDDYLSEEVLKKEIKEILSLDVYQEVMSNHVEKVLRDKNREAETAKMEVAKAIGLMDSTSPLVQKLDELLHDESPEVRRYAVESAAKLKKREHVRALIQNLSNPLTRDDARAALEKYGQEIVGTLGDYLKNPKMDIGLRKAVASVLARIGTQEAADSLTHRLSEKRGDMDTELIDALDRIRSEKPDVQFPEKIVMTKIAREIKKCYQILIETHDSKLKSKKDEMSKGLPKNLKVSLMNIFKLLGLIYPYEDIMKAYQNAETGTKDSLAYAVELLDNTLKKNMKNIILPIIEDLSLEERVKRCKRILKTFPEG